MKTPTEAEITAITDQPLDPARAVRVPGDPDTAKRPLSARVPETTAQWIYDEAQRRQVSPSLLTAELLTEAIAARQRAAGVRRVVDVDEVHRMIESVARAA